MNIHVEKKDNEKKRYTLQGDAFRRVEALSQAFIAAHEAASAAEKALWEGIEAECDGIDLEGGNYSLNRQYHDEGILFVEPGGTCGCPVCLLAGGGMARGTSLGELLKGLFGGGEEDAPGGKTH